MKEGMSATLWADAKSGRKMVARMSTMIQPRAMNLSPCDGEAMVMYVAGKSPAFSIPIRAAEKRTLAILDKNYSLRLKIYCRMEDSLYQDGSITSLWR